MERISASVVLLIAPNRKVLVATNRRYGGLTLPGGKVRENESYIVAARRELFEESGITVLEKDLFFLDAKLSTITHEQQTIESMTAIFLALASTSDGSLVGSEEGTVCSIEEWGHFLERTRFRRYYEEVLPRGIEHLRTCSMMFVPSKRS